MNLIAGCTLGTDWNIVPLCAISPLCPIRFISPILHWRLFGHICLDHYSHCGNNLAGRRRSSLRNLCYQRWTGRIHAGISPEIQHFYAFSCTPRDTFLLGFVVHQVLISGILLSTDMQSQVSPHLVVSGNGGHRRSIYYISWWYRIQVQFRRYWVYHRWESSNEIIEFLEILMWAARQSNALSLTIYTTRIAVFGPTVRVILLRTWRVSFSMNNVVNLIHGLIW